jgi:hypothetical protein
LKSSNKPEQNTPRRRPPATTPEARENQMIDLAISLVEKRLMNGTASSQETTHFLKLGSTKERLEKEILEKQKDLITAKTESIQSARRIEEMYKDAMKAFSTYSGNKREDDDT